MICYHQTFLGLENAEDEESYRMMRKRERRQVYLRDYSEEYCSITGYGEQIIRQRLKLVHWIVEVSAVYVAWVSLSFMWSYKQWLMQFNFNISWNFKIMHCKRHNENFQCSFCRSTEVIVLLIHLFRPTQLNPTAARLSWVSTTYRLRQKLSSGSTLGSYSLFVLIQVLSGCYTIPVFYTCSATSLPPLHLPFSV